MKFLVSFLLLLLTLPAVGADALRDAPTFEMKQYHEVHAKGLKRDPAALKALKLAHKATPAKAYGPIVGPVDISDIVSLPRNQGSCGSCWAYSITKALQSEFMINGLPLPGLLDTNYLIGNCGGPVSEGGCGGGDFPAAKNCENGLGPWGNGSDPGNGRCQNLPAVASAESYVMIGGDNGPTFQDMLAYISGVADGHKHLVSVDVAAGAGSWESYGSGTYNGCSGSANSIDHMIDAYGGDCPGSKDANGVIQFDASGRCIKHDEVIFLENNWGESWGIKASNGHGGYMKSLFYGSNGQKCNAIATDALIFTIKYPAPVDGGWSDWSPCLNGNQSRTCTNPSPLNGGAVCVGSASQTCGLPVVGGLPAWVWIVLILSGVAIAILIIVVIKEKE